MVKTCTGAVNSNIRYPSRFECEVRFLPLRKCEESTLRGCGESTLIDGFLKKEKKRREKEKRKKECDHPLEQQNINIVIGNCHFF